MLRGALCWPSACDSTTTEGTTRPSPGPLTTVSSTENVLPVPDSLCTRIVPPIASTRDFESVSPRPVPSTALASAPRLSKGVNSRASLSAAIPSPVSVTRMRRRLEGHRLGRDGHDTARAVVLDAVREEIQEHLLQALSIGQDVQLLVDRVGPDRHAGLGRRWPDQLDRLPDRFMEGNRLQRQLKPSSFDPAEVEHFVDEAQQVAAAAENLLDALSLFGRRSVQLQQLRKAQDRVQGRAKLVAHPRQELALRLIRAAGLGGCGAQLSSALLHPGLELFRLPLDALVETRLRDGDRELCRHFLRDAHLLRWELLAPVSAEADRTDELAADDHRDDHVLMDARGEQSLRLGARGERVDVDHLRLAPAQGLQVAGQSQRIAEARPGIDAPTSDRRQPLDLAGFQIEQVHDRARQTEQVS